jgi:hypothetical protein
VGHDDCPEPGPLVVVERSQLVVVVEDPTVLSGTRVLLPRVMPLRDHLASQGSPNPQGPVDPVVVESLDALEHDDVRVGPGTHTLAEHQHPRAPLGRHASQPLGDPHSSNRN